MPGANQKYAEVWKELGTKVQFLRKTAGLSQAKLAEKIEKTEDTISNIERGIGCTKLETLIDICDVLGTNIIDLFSLKNVDYTSKKKSELVRQIIDIISSYKEKDIENILTILEKIGEIE
ncbi:helix-turn-helix domain-containing protein [Candidatus Deianiraea vastatrix]|uniref:Transcriptional regulator n=1 Tax=Candidatus Deianiraea vastatrix TaxID=2163644 RepID=A0A5B8XGE6_9RICK|nr:helix-turn-helix domain-containing protein [Candidatus Deianiraea vastatrix]QED23007.1 Putative transcriptional regulator [Candidatus Deianiraea vastatrix]